MTKKKIAKKKTADAISAEWWRIRRADIIAELQKDERLRQTITVQLGRSALPGTFTLEAYHNDFPMPLAVIWYAYCGRNIIQINNIYTFDPVRRCGLMQLLFKTMRKWWPTYNLVTGAATKRGRAFMVANGWKQTDAGWELKRK